MDSAITHGGYYPRSGGLTLGLIDGFDQRRDFWNGGDVFSEQ